MVVAADTRMVIPYSLKNFPIPLTPSHTPDWAWVLCLTSGVRVSEPSG